MTDSKQPSELVVGDMPNTERLAPDEDKLEIGQWYWADYTDYKGETTKSLGVISHIGSNYVQFTQVSEHNSSWRIRLSEFDKLCTPEPDSAGYISRQVENHRHQVAVLLDRVKQITASLGIVPRGALAHEVDGGSAALAVASGTADIKAHKNALIKAKDETLPELFKKVKEQHELMAMWMKADLLPMNAELARMRSTTAGIADRIFTVELYAGLTEEMVKIQDGEPAPNDTKVSLFQRRHYMDEECLAQYEAGGMDYKNIEDFDEWLLRPTNLNRILPLDRCIVAFRIRRNEKVRRGRTMSDFIKIMSEADADKSTFLFIRNGQQVFRLETSIDFGAELFPDVEQSTLLNSNELWIDTRSSSDPEPKTTRQRDDHMIERAKERKEYAEKLLQWKRDGKKKNRPWNHFSYDREFERLTPDHIYYDDVMEKIQKAAKDHNRVAVVLQGLLDRSPALHPHPPWQLWKHEGFMAGIELVYDNSRVITSGEAPNFQVYRAQLNKSIKRGSLTIGQDTLWQQAEAIKENERRSRRGSSRSDYELEYYQPYGNPGPGYIAEVMSISRNGKVTFEWERERSGIKWVNNPDRPGYMKPDDTKINTSFTCSIDEIFNVSAYTPGDFKMFFADPRTRADYLEWAPFMLAAEDFHAGKIDRD